MPIWTMVKGQMVFKDGKVMGERRGRMARPKVAANALVTV